jgi:hypothetical protein
MDFYGLILRKKKWSEDEINILQTLAKYYLLYRTHQREKPFMKVKRNSFIMLITIPGGVYLSKNDAKYILYLNEWN